MLKVAIATPDGKQLWNDHFGQAPFYLICEFDGKQWVKGEMRKNPLSVEGKHAHPDEVCQILPDCAIFAARDMGKKSRRILEESGVITFLKEVGTVEEIISLLPAPEALPI